MLVLSRKVGERVLIAADIVVEVLEVRGRSVRLGIKAPAEVLIWREELSSANNSASMLRAAIREPR